MEEESEDGVFLVIIDGEASDARADQMPVPIKREYLDESDDELNLTDLMEKIQKYGVKIDVKTEKEDCEEETVTQCFEDDSIKDSVDKDDEDYVPDIKDVSDEEEVCTDDGMDRNNGEQGSKKRVTMREPWAQQSYVDELRKQYEELNDDPNLLIETLTDIMRNVKPPPLPKNYYIVKDFDLVCVVCGAVTDTVPAAGRHYLEKHGERYLVCFACGVDFRSKTNLYKHEKRCIAPDAHIVLKARAAQVGLKGRGRPCVTPRPKSVKFPCQLCSAVFNSKATLQSHEHTHRGERPHRCHVCPAAYTSQAALLRHTKTHLDTQYICDYCGRSFKIRVGLVSHIESHLVIRKHECPECGRRFKSKSAMLLHVNKIHRKLPHPCACQICPKRYPRMSLLKAHMKSAHNLDLMTRKMFFKSLPTMTKEQVDRAKVVLECEAPSLQELLEKNLEHYENEGEDGDLEYNEVYSQMLR